MTPFEKWWKRYIKKNFDNKEVGLFFTYRDAAEASWEACAKLSKRLIEKHFGEVFSKTIAKTMKGYK